MSRLQERRGLMETYIVLMRMTEKGLYEIDKVPGFVQSLQNKLTRLDGELKGFYKVMGEIDYVAVFGAPNDRVALAFVMALGKSGYFTTTTLKGYSMSEMRESLEIDAHSFE